MKSNSRRGSLAQTKQQQDSKRTQEKDSRLNHTQREDHCYPLTHRDGPQPLIQRNQAIQISPSQNHLEMLKTSKHRRNKSTYLQQPQTNFKPLPAEKLSSIYTKPEELANDISMTRLIISNQSSTKKIPRQNRKATSRLLSYSKMDNHQGMTSLQNTSSNSLLGIPERSQTNTIDLNSAQAKPKSSVVKSGMLNAGQDWSTDQLELDRNLKKLEKMSKSFKSYFNAFKSEQITTQLSQLSQQEQKYSEESKRTYQEQISQVMMDDYQTHFNLTSKFEKLHLVRTKLDEVYQGLQHLNLNKTELEWSQLLQGVKSNQCHCPNNKIMNSIYKRRPSTGKRPLSSSTPKPKLPRQQSSHQTGTFSLQKGSKQLGQEEVLQPIEVSVRMSNSSRDLQIMIADYQPITVSLNSLQLNQNQILTLVPLQSYLQETLDQNKFSENAMNEIKKQNIDVNGLKKIQQLAQASQKDSEMSDIIDRAKLQTEYLHNQTNPSATSPEESSSAKVHQEGEFEWSKKDSSNLRHKKRIEKAGIKPVRATEQQQMQMVLENEVVRSLFDLDMCVVCKYSRILYRDFVQKLMLQDQAVYTPDKQLNQLISKTQREYKLGNFKFNDFKEMQGLLVSLLEIMKEQQQQLSKVLPLHCFFQEKSFKFMTFIFSMMIELYTDSFLKFTKDIQRLSFEIADLRYARNENDLLSCEVIDLKDQLFEAKLLVSSFQNDKQVIVKEIEKDIDSLNENFNSHTRKQDKMKVFIEKEIKQAMTEMQFQNKAQSTVISDLQATLLGKFEFIKNHFVPNQSVGTQTASHGTSPDRGYSRTKGAAICSQRDFWKVVEIYKPLILDQQSARRYYEVFEVQAICEDFTKFFSQVKLKPKDVFQLSLKQLPNTNQQLPRQRSKQGRQSRAQGPGDSVFQTYTIDKKNNIAIKALLKYGDKDQLLNYMTEYFTTKKKSEDNIMAEISHLAKSMSKVAAEKNLLSARLLLVMMNYNQGYIEVDDINKNNGEASTTNELSHQTSNKYLSGALINIDGSVGDQVTKLMCESFYLLSKVFKKDQYLYTLLSKSFEESQLQMHKIDLKNSKLSLPVIFVLFEKMLGKASQQLKQDLIDILMKSYAQNNEYREATESQKFFSIVATQVMQRNKTSQLHFEWLIDILFSLSNNKPSLSIQDVINQSITQENVFDVVFEQQKQEKQKISQIIEQQQITSQKGGDDCKGKHTPLAKRNSSSNQNTTNIKINQESKSKTRLNFFNNSKLNNIDKTPSKSSINQDIEEVTPRLNLQSKLPQRMKTFTKEIQQILPEELNHINSEEVRAQLDQKVEYLMKYMPVQNFIRFLNYSKIYFPVIKEALEEEAKDRTDEKSQRQRKNSEFNDRMTEEMLYQEQQMKSLRYILRQDSLPCTLESFFTMLRRYLIKDRTYLLSLIDFVSLCLLMMMGHLEDKKKIVFEKFRLLDPTGKGIKEADLQKLLLTLDFHHILKNKQLQHIFDELKSVKLLSISSSNKLNKFQQDLEEHKNDKFLTFKYGDIQQVVENKWYLLKEIILIKEDFLGFKNMIKNRKQQYLQELKAGSLLAKDSKVSKKIINK